MQTYREKEPLMAVEVSSPEGDRAQACTVTQTTCNLTSFVVGAGLLNVPLALVESRWYGAAMVIFGAFLCTYTSQSLVKCLDAVRWTRGSPVSYGDIADEAFGKYGKWIIEFQLYLSLFSCACGYLMITSNYISILFSIPYVSAALGLGLVVWTHIYLKTLRQISVFSALNIGLAFWVESVIIADAMYPSEQPVSNESGGNFAITYPGSVASENLRLAYSFVLIVSAFFCHPALPTMYNSMITPRECRKVVLWSLQGSLVFFYLPICLITYAVYGTGLKAPVFMNLRNSTVRDVAILLFSIHLLLSYIVTLYPVEQALEQIVPKRWNRMYPRTIAVVATVCVVCLVPPGSHFFFLIITIPVAILALIFPPIFYLKLFWTEINNATVVINLMILAIGVWCLTFGFYSTWTCTMRGTPPA